MRVFCFYTTTNPAVSRVFASYQGAKLEIITSETVLPSLIAALSTIGLGFTAIYMAEQAWTDHRTDVMAFYQIPGA